MKSSLSETYLFGRRNCFSLHSAVIAAGIVIIISAAGCQEQNLSDTRKCRLIAAENSELKSKLEQCTSQLDEQRQLADKYLEEKNTFKERSDKATGKIMSLLLDNFEKETKALQEETENLKAKIGQLKKEVEELRKKPAIPDKPQPLQSISN